MLQEAQETLHSHPSRSCLMMTRMRRTMSHAMTQRRWHSPLLIVMGAVASSKTKSILGVVICTSSLAMYYNGGCILVLLRSHFCVSWKCPHQHTLCNHNIRMNTSILQQCFFLLHYVVVLLLPQAQKRARASRRYNTNTKSPDEAVMGAVSPP